MLRCAACGQENPDIARFCLACAAPLAQEPRGRELRKVVSVLFCDLAGSTSMGERLDAESLRRVMERYYEEMRRVIERHGGVVEKFIGDAVVAVFGIPLLHEDDALRAVRAAVDMRAALAGLNEELDRRWGTRLRTRIGINTGEVVAGDPSHREGFVVGDTVNVAARLEQAAPAGEILIGEDTLRLVRDALTVEATEPLALKGKRAPVSAYRLVEVLPHAVARVQRVESPLVGREHELALLEDALGRALERRACELATVLGPAGIGKSRLTREFMKRIGARARVLHGRCLSYGEGITFWPVAEMLREAFGLDADAAPEEVVAAAADLLPPGPDRDAVVQHLGAALGMAGASTGAEELFWAIRTVLEALASERPALLFLEDLHWAEPTLLDLVAYLASTVQNAPLLLLCTARADLLEPRELPAGARVALEPLSGEQSRALVESLLGAGEAAAGLVRHVASAADGNPLFIEEMLRGLADEGQLERVDGEWRASREAAEPEVPPTIHALLASRLDRLQVAEREVLERASVIGQQFWPAALRELLAGPERDALDARLDELVRKELIRPGGPPFAGEDAFSFGHVLIREVAYAGLLKDTRAEFHGRFAGWLEQRAGERAGGYAEILGYHLERAHRTLTELGPLDEPARELGARAAHWLTVGGRRALARGDMPAAVNLLERAMALLGEDDPGRDDLALKLGIALAETGDVVGADALLSQRVAAELRGKHLLFYRDGDGRQQILDLDAAGARVTVGRKSENELALGWDSSVSRYHAALERAGEAWVLVDEGRSRNGSQLNGERVSGRHPLADGDVLRFGDSTVLYRAPMGGRPALAPRGESAALTTVGVILSGTPLAELERRVLAAAGEQLTRSESRRVSAAQLAAALSLSTQELEGAVAGLCLKLGAAGASEDERLAQIVEQARRSGALG